MRVETCLQVRQPVVTLGFEVLDLLVTSFPSFLAMWMKPIPCSWPRHFNEPCEERSNYICPRGTSLSKTRRNKLEVEGSLTCMKQLEEDRAAHMF
jgi:hypothetical protein